MSKPNAYNTKSSDTSFRKTWDRDEYAAKAQARDESSRADAQARHEARLAGKKYVRRASTPPDARDTEARAQRLDVASQVGKTMIVPAGAAIGKKGRGAGFYCDACDLTFKDNLQLVEHLNSRQHLVATGQTGDVKRAGAAEVRERLRWLKRKREEEKKEEVVDLEERLERRREEGEREAEEKRVARREKRRRAKELKRGGGLAMRDPDDE